ncbi:hypothetical protein HanIR_Chr09g0398381 [Helianthus annuus]|nr:hypothetical protein HanIR_Chr09g0398381 [Helianthus annuus]
MMRLLFSCAATTHRWSAVSSSERERGARVREEERDERFGITGCYSSEKRCRKPLLWCVCAARLLVIFRVFFFK